MKIETLIVTLLPLAAAQSLQCNVVTSTILSTVTVSVSPTTATPVPSSVPIRVSSFNVSASQLSVVAAVQNIAYTKAITVPFCDQSSVCSGSFPCSYASKLNDTYETWTCSSSAFPNGATSFSLKYVVSGSTYVDTGPSGTGYSLSIAMPTTSSTTSSTAASSTPASSTPASSTPASSTTASTSTAYPSMLPGCQNFNGLDACSGNQFEYSAGVESRRWQTPPRNDPAWNPGFQDYNVLTGYADVVYNAARTAATLTVKPSTRDAAAVVACSFGGTAFTTTLSYAVTNAFTGALTVTCKIANSDATLVLDDFYFYWDQPAINRAETLNGQKGAIVELFGWPYNDIAQECEFLGKAGYMGLRVWAPNEHIMSNEWMEPDGSFNPWYFAYQPVSYKLQSRQGSLKELRAMITACRKFGVRVYADAVVNHMTGNGNAANNKRNQNGGTCSYWDHHNSTAQSPYYTHGYTYKLDPSTGQRPALEYPAVPYGPSDFHCERSLDSYTSGFVMQYGWLSGLADLHTGKDSVRERIATYMATLLSVGFSGFRVDAAKHISPDDLAAIFGKLAKKMGGSLPPEFITYLEVLIGGEKDLLCCTYSNYDYYQYFTDVLGAAGLSQTDIAKIKIWSSDYPKEFPVCGRRILPDERFVIQNDDHDQQNGGSTSRDMQGFGSVLIKDKDINAHRGFEVQLFARTDGSWAIRQVLSGWYFNAGSNAVGWPDGKSDCSLYSGNQTVTCGNVPYHKAYVADACGYSMLVNGNWEVGAYTRVHRDTSIINAMRKWMGLASTNQAALGIPSSCP
ncbi:hypothetical protein HDV03_000073 [Kappamyces sp. JEL0829]|nr:hypothetical protein HDV03_000073 [Kappamyces sp. JEL0829]